MPVFAKPRRRYHPAFRFLLRLGLAMFFIAFGWSAWVIHEIDRTAEQDQARPADAIAVFGAAEYAGRPSPVYHARLDHAVDLYQRQIAPLVITLGGGSDKDSGKTEGGVGRDYLLANGVPLTSILAETKSFDTEQQVTRLAEIAKARGLRTIVAVSDPTHLYRISVLCSQAGLEVYTSPRARLGKIDRLDLAQRYAHEILSYTALRLGVSAPFLRLEGKSDD